jgi:hypothetical protein
MSKTTETKLSKGTIIGGGIVLSLLFIAPVLFVATIVQL